MVFQAIPESLEKHQSLIAAGDCQTYLMALNCLRQKIHEMLRVGKVVKAPANGTLRHAREEGEAARFRTKEGK